MFILLYYENVVTLAYQQCCLLFTVALPYWQRHSGYCSLCVYLEFVKYEFKLEPFHIF